MSRQLIRSIPSLAFALSLTVLALRGDLTVIASDQIPAKVPSQQPDAGPAANRDRPANSYKLTGRCVDRADGAVMPGIMVRLYMAVGRTTAPIQAAFAISDARGEFEFNGLAPPNPEAHLDRLTYEVIAFDEFRPIGVGFQRSDRPARYEISMLREAVTLSGRVIDAHGKPVPGAVVMQYSMNGLPIEGVLSDTTDAAGKFAIKNVAVHRDNTGAKRALSFRVRHSDFPVKTGQATGESVEIMLSAGCLVTGKSIDRATGKPVAGALVSAVRMEPYGSELTATDDNGEFRMAVAEGRYQLTVDTKDRVCAAITDQECLAGETVNLPPFEMILGGFITGRVINTATGKVVTVSESGNAITIGLFSPARPSGKVISPMPLSTVDESGRFTIRAFPGRNFLYFVNTHGSRMAWDTDKQPPVIVKEGETTTFDMLITPPRLPAEKMQAARDIVAALPKPAAERTARIISEFRKVNNDETEVWCLLMRELVTIGRAAAPALCDELDQTTENRMLRRLGFALRAIGDPRGVPALIRAIPKSLLPSSSDYGLIVADPGLTEFMQKHDLDEKSGGTYFSLGRPVREIFGAIHALTGQNFQDAELFGMSLSEDPRRQVLQRRPFHRQALRWQTWWELHWRELTDDAAYQQVKLVVVQEDLAAAAVTLGPNSRLGDGLREAIVSPAIQEGRYAVQFYDLDTLRQPKWPAEIPRDESQFERPKFVDSIAENGVDLMCVTHRAADGTETFVLKAIGMSVREISPRELRNLDKLIAGGTLPEGLPVEGDLLMHYDTDARQFVPAANAAFIFITKEGSLGLIEVTDRITRTADPTGDPGRPPGGVGFFLGVRFNLKSIVP